MKAEHPDALLFFRMGDFYEMFFDDAVVAAEALEIALTSRSKDREGEPIPMCGVPHHAAPGYVARLVKQGHRVALCEQVEDPRLAKGVVKREVVRVITPGTQLEADRSRRARRRYRAGGRRRRLRAGRRLARPDHRRVLRGRVGGPDRWDRCATRSGPRGRGRSSAARDAACRARRLPAPEAAIPRAPCDAPDLRRRAPGAPLAHFGVVTLEAFGCEHLPRAQPRPRVRAPLRPRHPEARPHPRHAAWSRGRRRRPRARRRHPPQPGARGKPRRRQAARNPPGGARPLRARPWARACCGTSSCVPWSRWSASRTASTPWRSWRSARWTAAVSREALGVGPGPRPAARTGHPGHRRPARPAGSGRVAPRPARRPTAAARGCLAPLTRCPRQGPGDPPLDAGRPHRGRRAGRRSAGFRCGRAASIRDGVDPELDELREVEPGRPLDDRRHRGARARAHRHRVAQGPLQPGLRLLHRDQQVEPRPRAPRLRAQADDRGRRAVRHPGAQGVRGQGPARRRAHPGARGAALRGAARSGWPRSRGGCSRPRGPPPASTCSPPWPRWPACATT